MSIKRFESTYAVIVAGLVLSACASTPNKKDEVKSDKAAIERSKVYLESIEVAEASDSSTVCAVPAGLENSFSSGKGASAQWKDLLARASKCSYEKGWKSLETIAQTMSRLDIDSPWGPYFMSVAAIGTGDSARAYWMVDLAEKKAGTKLGLFAYQRGRIHLMRKETSKAMSEFEKAVALDPKLVDGSLFLADIYLRDGEWKEAATQYSLVLQKKPSHYRALVGMGESKYRLGDAQAAADYYSKALSADSRQLQAWVRVGEIYEVMLKNNEQALATYKDLRRSIESGNVKARPDFDLNAKIKTLEASVKPVERAQASIKPVDEKRSKK